ncbi:MAG: FAD-binding oxidoreductase [Gammaproteobacteria bacterium]|nr:FAD-binding oxidoreductase [Gammaproteobacteria bacterium]
MKDYDVAIIGGGLLGSAFAWGLADRGLRSVVFDEGDNAIRTARGNFGLVWVQGKGLGMPEYARWTLESSRQWVGFAERLRRETGVDTQYHRDGGFVICLDDDDFDSNVGLLEQLRREAGDGGYEFEIVEHVELRRRIPIVGDVPGATYCPHDGHCNPLRLLRALHTGYLNRGGEYRPWTRIGGLQARADGGFVVSAVDGKVVAAAAKLIVAAGHGSRELGSQVGLQVPIFPEQGQVVVTEKAAPVLNYPTNYVRQTDAGNFLLGPSSKNAGFDTSTEPATLRDITANCVRAFPLLDDFRVQRVWAALRVMTPDGFPVYQQSDSHPGAFSFACHSGVTLAANHALEVTEWVVRGDIPERYRPFHPRRFDVQANPASR